MVAGACGKCRHHDSCFEQRGRCAEFETEKQYRKRIKREIEQLNYEDKTASAESSIPADEDGEA